MRKLLVFVLLFVLFLHGAFQNKGKRRKNAKNNSSRRYVPEPRTFKGIPNPIIQTKLDLDATQTPNFTHSLPALQSLSDSAMGYLRGPLSTQFIPVIYVMVVMVGIPVNLTILCLLVAKVRKVFLALLYCSLAVSDLLLLLSLSVKVHYHLLGNHWVLGETACRIVTAYFYGNLYCSALTLACITVKRYMAVVHPFMYKSFPKMTYAVWIVVAVWAVFGAAIIPQLLVQQSFWIPDLNRTTCHDVQPLDYNSHKFLLYYNLVLTVLSLLVPLVVTVVCFIRIITELSRSHFDWAMHIKASSLVFSIFVVCFLPAGVLHFLHYVLLSVRGTESLYVYFNLAVCLCCLHACLDPFLFFIMSRSTSSRFYFKSFKGMSLSISV
ncbi:proteinase-activated receptor 3 [Kryptolebias marmoratus]|uniref:Coagulation factor II thrombin receptor like 2 n=1 Tax=Kryptolebias marmoratus TaxID=37003 RepID=A0A3Q3AXR9_KRYMA|nr:proteinase-activated receptor 3 [Kryptolebias marmoratus]